MSRMKNKPDPDVFKVATWNVNSLNVRLAHVLKWLETERPDVLALQETKLADANFPTDALRVAGYHASFTGQKTYNGVATLSKFPLETLAMHLPDYVDPQRRVLAINTANITVLNLYVPNGSVVGSEKYHYKLAWLAKLYPFVQALLAQNDRLIILGDLNIAPQDKDVYDPKAWEGEVLVSQPERDAFKRLLAYGFRDCLRLFAPQETRFSWWDYRAGAFRQDHGARIDHILASAALSCAACYIDKRPRKLPRPSDHAPVVAEFKL